MIKNLFPKGFQRYTTLPLLSPIIEEFINFLQELGYPHHVIRHRFQPTPIIDKCLRQFGCYSIKEITQAKLLACAPPLGKAKDDASISATVKLLEQYFIKQKLFPLVEALTPIDEKLISYNHYLKSVRGLILPTIKDHCLTASRFLFFLNERNQFLPLEISSKDTEDFICIIGKKIGRERLQHIIAHLRSFLNFLVMQKEIPTGLDLQIDTPRVYRKEKLPRVLDWRIVDDLIKSIDRSTKIGKRDYSILLLISTYGLRASEVVHLKLEDIEWRSSRLQIFQNKTTTPLILPLTNAVGESIIDYLRNGRPSLPCREVFVRHRAPSGTLKPTAVAEIFQSWSRRSGLDIKFQGPHCLRHSYAVHLLRQGIPLKTIGDILGHRDFESTCVYLRLNIEDLRAVPLSLPNSN